MILKILILATWQEIVPWLIELNSNEAEEVVDSLGSEEEGDEEVELNALSVELKHFSKIKLQLLWIVVEPVVLDLKIFYTANYLIA